MKVIMKNTVGKIFVFLLLLVVLLGMNTISRADSVTGYTTVVTNTEVPKTFNTTPGFVMMPQRSTEGSSGMFPQYYVQNAVRTVTLDNNRHNWFTNEWTATMGGQVVYCSAYGRYVRYGKYETSEHIIYPGINTLQGSNYTVNGMQTVAQSVNAAAERFKESVQNYININGIQYYENDVLEESALTSAADTVQVTIEYLNGGDIADINGIGFAYSGNVSSSGYELDPSKRGEAMNHAQNTSFNIFGSIFSQLTGIHPGAYSPSIDDGNYSYSINDTNKSEYIVEGNGVIGPEIIVIENGQGANNGYQNSGSMTFTNDQKAFIFSTSEDAYGDVKPKYTLNDIQGAYWRILRQEGDRKPTEDTTYHITANADALYEQSKKYMNFRNEILANGYENFVEFNKNDNEFQVVADRENGKYIIGPLSVTYPMKDYEDLSYLKALIVKGANGNNLVYDEKNSDFEVVLQTMPGATNNNGFKDKVYPQSKQPFYIVVSSDKIGTDTKKLELSARFEYITDTSANVNSILTANADIFRYYGHASVDNNSPYRMKQGTVRIDATYTRGTKTETPKHNSRCTFNTNGRCQHIHDTYCRYSSTGVCSERDCCYTKIDRSNVEKVHDVYQLAILLQPFIKMGTDVRTAEAQKLIVVGDAKRKYEAVTVNMENPIDLTMELGGFVWVDADGGKEDVSNGLYGDEVKDENGKNIEIKVPNVPVKLYRKDNNELIGETKTNANGEYRFKDLNAMYQYYVVFTYNGQYYQPTTFADATTWGTENWRKNSNAKDTKSVREAYNLKFESIGPAPENYKTSSGNYNETFTKLELLGYTLNTQGKYEKTREAVIDDFGNLILKNSTDPKTKKMIEYVKDCMIDASTIADGANGYYPEPSLFVIDNKPVPNEYMKNFHNDPAILYNDAYYINLGLDERQQSDLAVMKDIQKVTLEINGQTHDYTYDTLEDKANAKEQWDISVRLADHYYDTAYTRAVYESDYMYKTSTYGDAAKYGKSEKDELEVYITYKIMIDNQANSIQAKVNEIADYYDKDLEYIDERSYIEIKEGENKGKYSVKAKEESRYTRVEEANIDDEYENLYIIGLDDKYLEGGQRAYIYLTFRVEKNTEGYVLIDKQIQSGQEIGVGKENLVEINGYSTRYAKGTQVPNVGDVSFKPAGIVDRDSKPGNLKDTGIKKDSIYDTDKTVYTKFEDDNDKSPNLKLIVLSDYAREISGNVWEDLRDENINETATGNGIRSNNENTLIDGVTVQLVELMDNGTEYVWREFGDKGYTSEEFKALSQDKQKEGIGGKNTIGKGTGTGTKTSETPIINAYNLIKNYEFGSKQDGAYAFKSFVPGKYVVRFIYGDTVKTVAPKSLNMGGLNEKSYNGQDYKSTTYQEGITLNKTYEWRKESTWELGTEKVGDIIRKISTYDKNVCNQNEKGTYLHDISAADKNANVSDAKDIQSIRNAVNAYSKGEVANDLAEVLASGKAEYNTMNNRTQLFDKLIQNTKMTAETGVIVIELEYDAIETDGTQDRTYKVQNVNLGLEERPRAQLIIDKEVANAKITLANGSVLFDATNTTNNVLWKDHKAYDVGYIKGLMDPAKFGSIENIRKRNAKKFGLVQISMDEELMHGATMQITYKISAINVGEVDYNDNSFYYTGNVKDKNKVVTSNAKQVIDYVANNLQFSVNKNSNWEQISKAEIQSQCLVNEKIINELDKYNTIITSTSLDKELVPSLYKEIVKNNAIDTVSTQLVLTKVISPENDTDDLTYRNIVEIVKTTNTAGRRMEYSVVGNQIPGQEPQELDTDIAEAVKILPPFGNAGIYIIITITAMLALTIIILGTIFIKKKVLKK